MDIRNIAIIAHVDHGKTTLVDALLKQSADFTLRKDQADEFIMDSNELERERGITIFSKNAAIFYQPHQLPSHIDAMRSAGPRPSPGAERTASLREGRGGWSDVAAGDRGAPWPEAGGSGTRESSDRTAQGSASPEGSPAREAGSARSQGGGTARDVRGQLVKINIVDTPGHADFGGEVERIMRMVDGCLLLVDAKEGPMPQTRFVLKNAIKAGHRIIVVINKIDKPAARPDWALDRTFDLFIELGASERQTDFPVIYASGQQGKAGTTPDLMTMTSVEPLFDAIVREIPPPIVDATAPAQFLTVNVAADNYKGKLAIGRLYRGTLRSAMNVVHIARDGSTHPAKITALMAFDGLNRIEVPEATAGDIIAVAGIPEISIGETIADPADPTPLPTIAIEEPTVEMTFGVNTSPFSGREGQYATSRNLAERLARELETDVALRVTSIQRPPGHQQIDAMRSAGPRPSPGAERTASLREGRGGWSDVAAGDRGAPWPEAGGSGTRQSSDRAAQGSASPEGRAIREAGSAGSQDGATARDLMSAQAWTVAGRGELHLSILIEKMRREGYELQVSRPKVILKHENGETLEPVERVTIETPDAYSGAIIEELGRRRGEMQDMRAEHGTTTLEFIIPTRGLIGFRNAFLTKTKGLGIIHSILEGYGPYRGDLATPPHGSLIAFEAGASCGYGLANAQERGQMFVGSGVEVYEGMVVGENAKSEDIEVNVCKEKKLSNMRSKGEGEAIRLEVPREMGLEDAIEYIGDDELVEVTPHSVRIRKQTLSSIERKRAARRDARTSEASS